MPLVAATEYDRYLIGKRNNKIFAIHQIYPVGSKGLPMTSNGNPPDSTDALCASSIIDHRETVCLSNASFGSIDWGKELGFRT